MTQTTLTPHTVPHADPSRVRGRLSFDGVLRGEWIKLLALRSIRWSVAIMVILSWSGAALIAWAFASGETASAEILPHYLVQTATLGSAFTVLIMGVIGVLAITNEYASGLILSTFAAVPRRSPVLAAKALSVAALALAVGALGMFGSALLAAAIFGADGFAALARPEVLVSLLSTTVYLALAALFALAVGTLLRSSAGAIAVVVVLYFVAPIAMQIMMMTGWEWVVDVSNWLPANLGSVVAQTPVSPDFSGPVGYWGAMGGLLAWSAVPFVPAAILLKTRDAV